MFDNLKDKKIEDGAVSAASGTPSPFAPVAKQTAPVAANFGAKPAVGLEDIFSGSEGTTKPAAFQPKAEMASDPYAEYNSAKEPKVLINKLFFLATLVMVMALMGGGVYWGYNHFFASTGESTEDDLNNLATEQGAPLEVINDNEPEAAKETLEPEPEKTGNTSLENEPAVNPAAEIQNISTVDTDQDGLTDQEEIELGTNADSTDTDGDGLFDREEARVYKTDPLNPDTDGDTFLDGAEVRSGYNPNGEGKLFNL